jgi:hypothetical protein
MNVKEAQDEMKEQPDNTQTKRSLPLMKDESSLASDMNDATLVGSVHESTIIDANNAFDFADERYDKFNEMVAFPLGHSISRSKMPPLGPLIPLSSSSSNAATSANTSLGVVTRQRAPPQSFAQKLRYYFLSTHLF